MNKPHIPKAFRVAAEAQGLDIEQILREALHLDVKPGGEWSTKGVTFPPGTMFRTWFGNRPYWGEVKDGGLWIKDVKYTSPSAAAVSFTHRPTNGWAMWECMLPGSRDWKRIDDMRKAAQH